VCQKSLKDDAILCRCQLGGSRKGRMRLHGVAYCCAMVSAVKGGRDSKRAEGCALRCRDCQSVKTVRRPLCVCVCVCVCVYVWCLLLAVPGASAVGLIVKRWQELELSSRKRIQGDVKGCRTRAKLAHDQDGPRLQ
jgi:hypothetical protein